MRKSVSDRTHLPFDSKVATLIYEGRAHLAETKPAQGAAAKDAGSDHPDHHDHHGNGASLAAVARRQKSAAMLLIDSHSPGARHPIRIASGYEAVAEEVLAFSEVHPGSKFRKSSP